MSSISDALFGSHELRAMHTSIFVNSIEFIVWDRSGRSSMNKGLNVSIKTEWKYWLNKLTMSESELAVREPKCTVEGIDLDYVIMYLLAVS